MGYPSNHALLTDGNGSYPSLELTEAEEQAVIVAV